MRKVDIPKPDGGGTRTLGIPTVLDRLIQQALLQVLQPLFEPHFSEASYGFRPGRSAHDARPSRPAGPHGRRAGAWVVDLDLEKFFDRVNHDVLMHRVSRRVADRRVLAPHRPLPACGVARRGCGQPTPPGHAAGRAALAAAVQHPAG
ncbi:MAG: reverse transcriptase domain-containing protein [Arhodomonas sp.]|nr:reverse transcriptase domain-containing protein [Arhodomonas sp.]